METLQKLISVEFTLEVLQEILRKKTGISNNIIKNITFGDGTKKGESYLSVVTRFTVEFVNNNEGDGDHNGRIHVLAKAFPANLARRETFRSNDFFKNEIAFYNEVWPLLDNFQKTKNLKNPLTIVPECLASFCDGFNDFLVLDDLTYEGYSSMSRNTFLSFEDTAEIIREFGRFHGLSMAFKDQNPDEFRKIGNALEESYFDSKFRDFYTPIMNKMMWVLRDCVEKELPKEYLRKFDDVLKMDLFEEVTKICQDRSHLCGITHGDCWAPNFLVKYDKDGKFKTKFIDYQLARCSSVVMDLIFFLYICLDPFMLNERWDDLIEIYVETVSNFLKELGSDENLISVEKVNDGMKKVGLFTFVMCSEGIVMSSVEEEDVVDIDDIKEVTTIDNVWIIKLMEKKESRKRTAEFVKQLIDRKFI